MFTNRITQLFGIDFPLVQAGMVWTSGWKLAAAVSNAGGLGLIGAGSMYPDVLREHIQKCKKATSKPFGVNIPLLYPDIEKHIQIVIEEKIKIVVTSAGNPAMWTTILKQNGITVVHVISSTRFALKAQDSGCDAVVAEGFEAGGHNGKEETTTLVLVPAVVDKVSVPVIAAGGIATGKQMLAAMVLGAEGVQVGSRFVASEEASVHENFKKAVISASEGDTRLSMKSLTPVRLLRNEFLIK
jgi:enoyl-[acyl-carrier protein] reductase II